jgi:hypothetical protein
VFVEMPGGVIEIDIDQDWRVRMTGDVGATIEGTVSDDLARHLEGSIAEPVEGHVKGSGE